MVPLKLAPKYANLANLGHLEANLGHLVANLGHLIANLGHLEANLGHLEANLGHLGSNYVYNNGNFRKDLIFDRKMLCHLIQKRGQIDALP